MLIKISCRIFKIVANVPWNNRRLSLGRSLKMKVVGLISGGKDSCFNLMKCVAEGHEIVALANLKPPASTGELDSYMYQSAGQEMIEAVAEALSLPLYRQTISGKSLSVDYYYDKTEGDEVEDLYQLLQRIKDEHEFSGVASGAVLSDYQRIRVENVCTRLGLSSLAYLWKYDQSDLLEEMLACGVNAVTVKVASMGLDPAKHLNAPLQNLKSHLYTLRDKWGVHVCGEGGEYESLVLDCPLYRKSIVIDESRVQSVEGSSDQSVGYLVVTKHHLEDKPQVAGTDWAERVKGLPMRTSQDCIRENAGTAKLEPFEKQDWKFKNGVSWPHRFKNYVHVQNDELIGAFTAPNSGDIAEDTNVLMSNIEGALKSNGMDTSNLNYCLLYVDDMSKFGSINAVYTKYFGLNPPPRICVEAVLPSSSLFHAHVLASKKPKETRHVQSLSHWAPCAIGPYSQAAKVGEFTFISGQVGLVPATLVQLPSDFAGICNYTLNHVESVAEAMNVTMDTAVQAHCYVISESHVPIALDIAKRRLPEQVKPLVIVLPRLPKDVLAEWHINFKTTRQPLFTVCAGGEGVQKLISNMSQLASKDGLYFMFYNAGDMDVNDLLEGLGGSATYIPVPVHMVSNGESDSTTSVAFAEVPRFYATH